MTKISSASGDEARLTIVDKAASCRPAIQLDVGIDPSMMRAMILDAEAETFVQRFKQAADEVILELRKVHESLNRELEVIQTTTEAARQAAEEATMAVESIES